MLLFDLINGRIIITYKMIAVMTMINVFHIWRKHIWQGCAIISRSTEPSSNWQRYSCNNIIALLLKHNIILFSILAHALLNVNDPIYFFGNSHYSTHTTIKSTMYILHMLCKTHKKWTKIYLCFVSFHFYYESVM